jgi:hypothetical protein
MMITRLVAVMAMLALAGCSCEDSPERAAQKREADAKNIAYWTEHCALRDQVVDPSPSTPWCRNMNMKECSARCKDMGQQYRSLENGSCKCWPSGVVLTPRDLE